MRPNVSSARGVNPGATKTPREDNHVNGRNPATVSTERAARSISGSLTVT